MPISAPSAPAEDRKSPPKDPSSGTVPSAGPAANRTIPSKDPSGGTPPASHGEGAPFKSAHEDTVDATSEDGQNFTSTSGKEADAESLNLNMEITDEEDITEDEAQDTDGATIDNINNLFREAISDIREGQDLLQNTKAQNMKQKTSHKKKFIRKVKVRSAQQRERKSPRRSTQSKAPVGQSSTVESNVIHNDMPIKLKGGPNGDTKRQLRRGGASGE